MGHVGEARSYFVSAVRRRVSFVAAVAHARMRLARLQDVSHMGRTADRHTPSYTTTHVSATCFERACAAGWSGGLRSWGRD